MEGQMMGYRLRWHLAMAARVTLPCPEDHDVQIMSAGPVLQSFIEFDGSGRAL